ncbi:hypothetical protein M128_3568 [Bacteroides fragilis str. S6L8]|uniref:Uncharacterized protein n=5 Tax=Bacteroides fragilis TaxID=817 RepID=A0A015X9T0_BACFG|nr:hypothetical protein M101_3332 [Bacteroides fragilis str. 1007-1-F \
MEKTEWRTCSNNHYQKYNIETFSILHTLVGRIKNQPQNK